MNQLTGYVYLQKPVPTRAAANNHEHTTTATPPPVPLAHKAKLPSAPPASVPASAPGRLAPLADSINPDTSIADTLEAAPRPVVGRLLTFWLEALAGRRSLKTLQRAPFTPMALADLERTIAREHGILTASGIKSLHIQPGAGRRTRFCASVAFGTRVRAVVGTLSWRRLDPRMRKPQRTHAWHVEVIQII